MIKWQEIFSKDGFHWQDAYTTSEPVVIARLDELKRFLDAVHIRFCLVKPYQEHKNYPLVEGRELLPSLDNDMFEYKDLPGFSMVAFARQLDYFSETFQFDKLHPIVMEADGACCPLENQVLARNVQTLASRLPRMHQDIFRQQFANADTVILDNYPSLMPYLLAMDRAQVLALDADRQFYLAGVFASFPSDIDSELKRFGMRIGKFVYGDSEIYERNRMFVYQYLMELYGFPIVSERRTSSALFARKLHKLGEHFILWLWRVRHTFSVPPSSSKSLHCSPQISPRRRPVISSVWKKSRHTSSRSTTARKASSSSPVRMRLSL